MRAAFKRLLGYFAGGMAGYTAGIAGMSTVDVLSLLVGTAAVADLTLSGGVVAASTAVLIGTFGFLKHHARFHEYDDWMAMDAGEIDPELMAELAASGGPQVLEHGLDALAFIENKEERRQDFLHTLAAAGGLRFDGLRQHVTDKDTTKANHGRRVQENGANRLQRGGLTLRNLQASGRAAASLLVGGRQKAKETYAAATDHLTRTGLARLLQDAGSRAQVLAQMRADTAAQQAMLHARVTARIAACGPAAAQADGGDGAAALPLERMPEFTRALARDVGLHGRARELLQMLDAAPAGEPVPGELLARYRMLLQWDERVPDADAIAKAPRELAVYLMERAPEDYRRSRLRLHRGLLETAPLMRAARAEAPAPQLPMPDLGEDLQIGDEVAAIHGAPQHA